MTETDYPGDVHWYDMPDDEAETDETSAPESRRTPLHHSGRPPRIAIPSKKVGIEGLTEGRAEFIINPTS